MENLAVILSILWQVLLLYLYQATSKITWLFVLLHMLSTVPAPLRGYCCVHTATLTLQEPKLSLSSSIIPQIERLLSSNLVDHHHGVCRLLRDFGCHNLGTCESAIVSHRKTWIVSHGNLQQWVRSCGFQWGTAPNSILEEGYGIRFTEGILETLQNPTQQWAPPGPRRQCRNDRQLHLQMVPGLWMLQQ